MSETLMQVKLFDKAMERFNASLRATSAAREQVRLAEQASADAVVERNASLAALNSLLRAIPQDLGNKLLGPHFGFEPWGDRPARYNGSGEPCDMWTGTCSCGATHTEGK